MMSLLEGIFGTMEVLPSILLGKKKGRGYWTGEAEWEPRKKF